MTPAIKLLESNAVPFTLHAYEHNASTTSYGMEAVSALNLDPARVFKTLIVATPQNSLCVGVVPVSKNLSLKSIAKVLGEKKIAMADKAVAQLSTGYVLGGVSPLGQRKRLRTVIDTSALNFDTVYVSAGKRGLEIEIVPQLLIDLCHARVSSIAT